MSQAERRSPHMYFPYYEGGAEKNISLNFSFLKVRIRTKKNLICGIVLKPSKCWQIFFQNTERSIIFLGIVQGR